MSTKKATFFSLYLLILMLLHSFFALAVAKLLNKDDKIAFNKVRVELSESLENGKYLL